METTLKEFLAYLAVERGLAKNTVESYAGDLVKFSAFLSPRKRRLGSFRREDVMAFLDALRG
ncbi:MAG: site-specific integrase, partial [Nitrospirota bacterium]